MRMVADDIPPDRMNDRPIGGVRRGFPGAGRREGAARRAVHVGARPAAGRSPAEKIALSATDELSRLPPASYWGLDDVAADTFQGRSHDFFAAGIDARVGAGGHGDRLPGVRRASICRPTRRRPRRWTSRTSTTSPTATRRSLGSWFDRLIPAAAPGETMEDIVTARFDYAALERPGRRDAPRLGSTVVQVAERARTGSTSATSARIGCTASAPGSACSPATT